MVIEKSFSIPENSQKKLLALARAVISGSSFSCEEMQADEILSTPAAVFTTLEKNGGLRGCIGMTQAVYPLFEAVKKTAKSAAERDPRFYPVEKSELEEIKIEISVLSPMIKVKSAGEIIENKHGVYIEKGSRAGLFLPQVWEHFGDKEDFLNELCSQKAGIPKNAWKDGSADIFVFTVFSFKER